MRRKQIEKEAYINKVQEWRELKAYGDVKALAEKCGVSIVYMSNSINTGMSSLRILREVDKFYNKRKKRIKK